MERAEPQAIVLVSFRRTELSRLVAMSKLAQNRTHFCICRQIHRICPQARSCSTDLPDLLSSTTLPCRTYPAVHGRSSKHSSLETPHQFPTEVALVIHHRLNSNRRPTAGDKYSPSTLHPDAAARAELARGSQSHMTLSSRKLTPPRDF
jgi:hypothetical protein